MTLRRPFSRRWRRAGRISGSTPWPSSPLCHDCLLQRVCDGHDAWDRPGGCAGGLLVYVMGVMGYYWLMVNLFPIAQAALATAIQSGLAGTGGTSLSIEMINKPSFIMTEGLKSAYPMADQASWFERIWATSRWSTSQGSWWLTGVSCLPSWPLPHHMMMLIEYHSSSCVLRSSFPGDSGVPPAASGEFAVGWLTGGFIRALVSTAMLGIALPLFALLTSPPKGLSPSTTR